MYSSIKIKESFSYVIFGATGDLSKRKLIPSLFRLFSCEFFSGNFAIICTGRKPFNSGTWREYIRENVFCSSEFQVDIRKIDQFLKYIHYIQVDFSDLTSFKSLATVLESNKHPLNIIFHLAVSPDYYSLITEQLALNKLLNEPKGNWRRLIIEKPFGRDLKSAHKLNLQLKNYISDTNVFRIDHYLGKETVQNILTFRFGNAIFEPLFNNRYIDHIQINVAESLGIGSRVSYYDSTGALRDMVQNHLLQLLCLIAMEPPSGLDPTAIQAEKFQVLNSIKKMSPDLILTNSIRGQYGPGNNDNNCALKDYRSEDPSLKDSTTETFVALRLEIKNWRWAGVPFLLRTGKRLKKKSTQISIFFKRPPMQLFETINCNDDNCNLIDSQPNVLTFIIQPEEGFTLQFSTKRPGPEINLQSVDMHFDYQEAFPFKSQDAYERLILDVVKGDHLLFPTSQEVEAAWEIITPIIETWGKWPVDNFPNYPAGSWGPDIADSLFNGLQINKWKNE